MSTNPSLHGLSVEELSILEPIIQKYHTVVDSSSSTCTSLITQRIDAPVSIIWPFVRDFGRPNRYKHFIRSCTMQGDGGVGSIRDVEVISGLPASTSKERLEMLEDENHVLSFRVVGGVHRLHNYCSVTSVNELVHKEEEEGKVYSIVLESYSVEIPQGNTAEDTKLFADTVVKLNLQKLRDRSMASLQELQEKP
ncbi:Abscisic acid receptor pyl2 [Turnera subulata]|uniref:Abscisic acid receptor pyl2 n=1 Tax=Turnera subulata TaxID=218843 RepID=A0A9Q0FGS6_9ROSI|nr:Abscisic acid receptor pyl2 [Turnera subulata]